MITMYLAAKHPDLFAAELLVSGQWDISELKPLATQKFFYIAAGGDEKASGGQRELLSVLRRQGPRITMSICILLTMRTRLRRYGNGCLSRVGNSCFIE